MRESFYPVRSLLSNALMRSEIGLALMELRAALADFFSATPLAIHGLKTVVRFDDHPGSKVIGHNNWHPLDRF